MKRIEKKKPKKQTLVIIIAAATLVLMIASAIIAKIVVDNISENNTPTYTPPSLKDGEALLNNYYTVAYPQVEATKIQMVTVKTPDGEYGIWRPGDNQEFYIEYTPEGSDKTETYYPPITEAEGSFDYSTLFAVGDNDYGMTNVFYLCSVVGTMYFDERIELPTDKSEFDEECLYYGFSEDSIKRISFTYKNADGETKTRTITLGSKTITDMGYYYMIDDRPYIYVTTSSYIDYALGGASSLINSMLVAEGLAKDSYLEPYLTPEYKQWVTTLHDKAGDVVKNSSNVIVTAEILSPQNPTKTDNPSDFVAGGYVGAGFGKTEFDLSEYTGAEYAAMIDALVGKQVGSYEGNEIIFTIVGAKLAASIPDGADEVTYTYNVSAIEAILDGGDNVAVGTPVGSNKLLKITYTATVDGESVTPAPYHAVIDLGSELIPAAAKAAFSEASIGTLSSPIEFSVTYSKSDLSNQTVSELVITELLEIYDAQGNPVDTVADGCVVAYSYVIKLGSKTSETFSGWVDLAADADNDNAAEEQFKDKMRQLLVGKKKGEELSVVVETYVEYPEVMADFDTVTVKEIHGYVESRLVVSFKFVNEEDRDPFYGESIYENTLDNNNANYALNNTVCETVVKILGGIDDQAGTSLGLTGYETVAVGLNTETILKYFYSNDICDGICDSSCADDYKNSDNLAYKIRFALPRNISDDSAEDEPSDYQWTHKLTFTLYISREHENKDGSKYRYAASDMYGVVTKVDAAKFVFLKYDFVEFWARRSPMLLSVDDITSLKLDFYMSDVYGSYSFELDHTEVYYDANGKEHDENAPDRTPSDFITLWLSVKEAVAGGGVMDSALKNYISENGYTGKFKFAGFYDAVYGGGKIDYDTADVAFFKNVIQMIYLTNYTDMLTEEEQQAGALLDPIMSMELGLAGTSDKYVYEFRRIDERRIMVSVIKKNASGDVRSETSDFYISTPAMREIVTGFVYLFNGLEVDPDLSYEPLP